MMDDEFKLCWKNFQDNIASGFQNLYDRGDLVDVTLACDGKLLQAHKFVLAICSPYFQEIFITNPCKHPIIILKDVSYNIMCELLEFMYQGVVNVKHTELQTFMKIGQLLQIKGLATNSSSSAASTSSEKSLGINKRNEDNDEIIDKSFNSPETETGRIEDNLQTEGEKPSKSNSNTPHSNQNTPHRSQSPLLSPTTPSVGNSSKPTTSQHANKLVDSQQAQQQLSSHANSGIAGHKRYSDYGSDSLSIYSRSKHRRSITSTDHSSENTEVPDSGSVSGAIEQMNTDDFFLPHISMVESRYDFNNIKRENSEHHQNSGVSSAAAAAAASLRSSFNSAAFGLDYTFYKNSNASSQSSQEYPNDLHMSNEYSKSFANHMDIPPNCPNVVMLSSTSLLHGNCVFNRNNTVATQQGMKTYWLCKSYRISMCRARCITHQGKIISATGVHNHPPHMRGNGTISNSSGSIGSSGSASAGNTSIPPSTSQSGNISSLGISPVPTSLRFSQNNSSNGSTNQHNYHDHHHSATSPLPPSTFTTNQHIHPVGPGEHWFQGKLEFMLSQRGKPLLVHDGHTFGIQYVRKDKKYWQCNLSRKFNCKARVTTTDTGEIIVTNNEHCHTEIRQHLRKDYQRNKVMMNALINLSTNRLAVENFRRHGNIANNLSNLQSIVAAAAATPLNLQSHAEETSSSPTINLLDLGKKPVAIMEADKHFKLNPTHPYNHRIYNQMSKPEEDDSYDEPLDCGTKPPTYHAKEDFQKMSNENNAISLQSTPPYENKKDWNSKNQDNQ